jgi:hypothetical protein
MHYLAVTGCSIASLVRRPFHGSDCDNRLTLLDKKQRLFRTAKLRLAFIVLVNEKAVDRQPITLRTPINSQPKTVYQELTSI